MRPTERITRQNLYDYCRQHGLTMYEKKAGSHDGVLFSLKGGKYLCNVRFHDILPGNENDFVSFEVHPGIHTLKEYYPMVAMYVQNIRSEFGVVQVDYDHGDVYFKGELPIIETAVCRQTIEMMLNAAVETLDIHFAALDALAHGYLPEMQELPPSEQGDESLFVVPNNTDKIELSIKAMSTFFEDANHNIVSVSSDNHHWLCEIFCDDEHYNLHVDCNPNGMARIRVGYGLETMKVDEPYRRMVAVILAKESATHKVSSLVLDDGYVFAQADLSLLDGPVQETLKHMERILIHALNEIYRDVFFASHGIIPEHKNADDDRESRLEAIWERMRGMPGKPSPVDDNDDDEADDHPEHNSFFDRLFGSHDDDEDPSPEDNGEDAIPF